MPSPFYNKTFGAARAYSANFKGSPFFQRTFGQAGMGVGNPYSLPTSQPEEEVAGIPQQEKIFSGGPVMDVVDAIQVPAYALAGLAHAAQHQEESGQGYNLKGLWEGIKEGVAHRASWRDLLKDHELFGVKLGGQTVNVAGLKIPVADAVGTALDIFIDPLNVPLVKRGIGAVARGTGKALETAAEATGLSEALRSIPAPQRLLKVLDSYADTPLVGNTIGDVLDRLASDRKLLEKFVELDDARVIQTAQLLEDASDVVGKMRKAPAEVRKAWYKFLTTGDEAERAAILANLPKGFKVEDFTALAEKGSQVFPKLGQQLVDIGALSPEALKENYLPRLFERFENPAQFIRRVAQADPAQAAALAKKLNESGFSVGKGLKLQDVEMGFLSQRKDLPAEMLKELGHIEDAPYAIAKGAAAEASFIAKSDFFRKVADEFAKPFADEGTAALAGYTKLADTPILGALSGKYVPEAIARQLEAWTRNPSEADRLARQLIGAWKYGKVVLNPATHVRNMLSNFLLADWGTGLTPLSPRWWKYSAQAAKELAAKGDLYKEARRAGTFLVDTFAGRELPQILQEAESLNPGKLTGLFGWLRATGAKLGDLYQAEEQLGKMTVYLAERDKLLRAGMDVADAAKQAAKTAEDWLFNYRKVPKWVDMLRTGQTPLGVVGTVPFLTFSYKAVPRVAETLLTNPTRISKYFKLGRGVEALSDQAETQSERRVLPDWMSKGVWVKLPHKDSYGRSLWLDLTYILPLADLGGASLLGPGQQPAFTSTPFLTLIGDIVRNRSQFTDKPIWEEGSTAPEVAAKIGEYLGGQLLPAFTPVVGYSARNIADAIAKRPDWLGRTRSLGAALAATLAGLKTRPLTYSEEAAARAQEYENELKQLQRRMGQALANPALSEQQKEDAWNKGIAQINALLAEMDKTLK